MTDSDRSTALRVFARVMRDPSFRKRLKSGRAVVCLEGDTVNSMLNALITHYPNGADVAVYYPSEHCFRFMEWSSDGMEGKSLDAAGPTTLGMAIASIRAEQENWAEHSTRAFSTSVIEKQLLDA